jgi:hypothetical protein
LDYKLQLKKKKSPLQFATPPGSDELEYLEEPTAVDTIHMDILTTALDQIASFQDLKPAPGSLEHEPSQLENIIIQLLKKLS